MSGIFTKRQRDVALLLLENKSTQEIADALGIGLRTVKEHIECVMNTLGVGRRGVVATILRRRPELLNDVITVKPGRKSAPRTETRRKREEMTSEIFGCGAGRIALEECWQWPAKQQIAMELTAVAEGIAS